MDSVLFRFHDISGDKSNECSIVITVIQRNCYTGQICCFLVVTKIHLPDLLLYSTACNTFSHNLCTFYCLKGQLPICSRHGNKDHAIISLQIVYPYIVFSDCTTKISKNRAHRCVPITYYQYLMTLSNAAGICTSTVPSPVHCFYL